jgi:hypothetical protein
VLVEDLYAASTQLVDFRLVAVHTVVEDDRQPIAELAEQSGRVEAHRMGDDLHDASVADLVAVAERAVDHVTTPVLDQAVDVGEFVDEARGGQDPSSDDRVPSGQFDTEPVIAGAADVDSAPVEDFDAVAANLLAGEHGELSGIDAFVAEIAVHVGRGGVTWGAGVDDDHRSPLTAELQRSCQPGGRPADHGDIASTLDGAWYVVAHVRRR